jgi:hypothetical protein
MAVSSPWLAVVLAFTLTLAASAGCSSKHLTPEQQAQADMEAYEAQVRKVVTDPARADQLIALTNEFQQQMRDSAAYVREYRAKVTALDSNYEATRADYQILLDQLDAHREAVLKKTAALREQLTALTTDKEWEELKKARLRMLEADLQDLLS